MKSHLVIIEWVKFSDSYFCGDYPKLRNLIKV